MRPNLQPLQSATKSTVALAIGLLCMSTGGGNAFAASPENDAVRSVEQAKTTVKGIVLDENGDPVIGASVVDASGKNGTVTDANGNFALDVAKGTTLKISYLGYNTTNVTASGSTLRVVLEPSNHELNEVVVTALGIKREKKSLGYAMQEVKTEGLKENANFSVANMLQGKVAGVQISQSGSGMGGSTRIVMRGLNSLSGKNQPLWVVDGFPINDDVQTSSDQWGGTDTYGAASQINPEDIASISVLKGANAAALYGSRAQNGAIIITTKSGNYGQPLSIEYTGTVEMNKIYSPYDYQNIYGQGSNGAFDISAKGSWGPKMEGQEIQSWRNKYYGDETNKTYAMLPQKDYIKDFYDTGSMLNNSLTASVGSKNVTSRFSFTDSRNKGITPNHKLNRQYFGVNTEMKNDYLTIGIKGNYMRELTKNAPAQGEYGVMTQLIEMPRSIRLSDLDHDFINQNNRVINWSGPSENTMNPYGMVMDENGNRNVRNRIIGQINATLRFTDYLKLTGRVGIDWYNDDRKVFAQYLTDGSNTDSQYSHESSTNKEFNADLMLNFNKRFSNFDINANIGAAVYNIHSTGIGGTSGRLQIPNFVYMGNGEKKTAYESSYKKEIQSILGNASIGYKSMVYLDLTGRNDWSSTLPKSNWSYFYPSVSLSGIISQMVKLPECIDYLKVRTSWAQVGNDTDPYKLAYVYSQYSSVVNGGSILEMQLPSTYPLQNLKPERTNSFEIGLEYHMFNNRLGLDFTYYNTTTKDQILSIGTAASSGYSSKMINAGKIASHGFEVMLSGTPIRNKDWEWDVNLNWGLNRTKCVSLNESIKRYTLGSTRVASVVVEESGAYGDIVATNAFKRNADGQILIGDDGLPLKETDKVVGNMMPKWTGSITNSLRWKDFSFNALVDVRYGGDFISMTDAYACTYGNSARTLTGRDGMVVDGIVESTGEKNTKEVTAEQYWNSIGGSSAVVEPFMYKGTYVKMRELSLGWNLPYEWLANTPLKAVKLSLVGRDLFYFYKAAPVNAESAFSRDDYAQAFEYGSMPPTRSFGFTINVKF